MTKDEFKKLCWQIFKEYGFKKEKRFLVNMGSSNISCFVDLQKSDYGEAYYINCRFGIKGFPSGTDLAHNPAEFFNRVQVMSVSMHNDTGKCFETQMICYEDYTAEQFTYYLKSAIDDWVMPPLQDGGKYVAEHQDKYMFLKRNTAPVIKALLNNRE